MIDIKRLDDGTEELQVGNLRLLRGGKGPPLSGGINWLNGLDKGTAFSCKKKGNTDTLDIYIIAFKYDRTVVLVNGFQNEHRFAVDPEEFCKKHVFWEEIGKEEQGIPVEGVEDGSSRSVLAGRVADDENAEGGQPEV